MRKELKKSFYEPPIMSQENNNYDKSIDLGKFIENNDFRVVKGNSPVASADKPNSLILDSQVHEHKASGIGLDLLANPQKKRINTDKNPSPPKIDKTPPVDKPKLFNLSEKEQVTNAYEKEAIEESLVDQEDLFQAKSNPPKPDMSQLGNFPNIETDKLSFVSTISSRKSSKKVHHFDLNQDSGGRDQGLENNSFKNKTFDNIPGSFHSSMSRDLKSNHREPIREPFDRGVHLNISKQENIQPSPRSIHSGSDLGNNIMDQLDRASSCSTPVPVPRRLSFEEIKKEKEDLIYKFEKMRRLGMNVPKRFNMSSDLDEMKIEYEKIKKDKEVENGIKFSRKVLMAITTGIEFLNNKFDPCDLKLDGWSESIHENIGEYDEVFEELNEKYKGTAKVSPEIKLLLMMGGSAFMFHLTNTMFKSSLPGMGDIMKQNPDLMKQFASAALNSMNDGGSGNQTNNNNNSFIPNNNPFENQEPVRQTGPKREMKGPSGVEEILQEFQNEQGDNSSMTSSQFERKMMGRTQNMEGQNMNRRQFNLNM